MKNLKTSFGRIKVNQSQKTEMVQRIFSNVTKKYDLMNDLMSFGAHRLWKKRFIDLINIQAKDNIIDVGSGTGDIVKLIIKNSFDVSITSIDLNFDILKYGKEKFKINTKKIKWLNCNAENLPIKNNFYDKYIISFCLRNITSIDRALSEALRVLKPGGSFYCLEFSAPESSIISNSYNFYKKNIIPFIGQSVTNNKKAYVYLAESISQFPHQDIFLNRLNKIGFVNTSFINLFNGIVAIHKGYKIK